MMRPDVKIAIAYGSKSQGIVADLLRNKLRAYQEYGYPVSVSIVKEDIESLKRNLPAGTDVETAIREMMEKYFSDFDYAVFLFDTKGKAIPEGETEPSPLISSNLIFEYGLASSVFINQELKTILCFAPKKIEGNALQYVKNLNFKYFDEVLKEKSDDIDAQTDLIIEDFIHYHKYSYIKDQKTIYKEDGIWFSFYGLPKELPKLKKDTNGKFIPVSDISIADPMELSKNNGYWADLRKLQPSGIRVALDEQNEALNELFKKEYCRFDDAKENQSEHILGRRLLYIIDRAVFIMYLRQEDYWVQVAKELYHTRIRMLKERCPQSKISQTDINKDYYIKSINALLGVFLYQQCSRPKKAGKPFSGTLFENLDKIKKLLKPVTQSGSNVGNRMIYCIAADYLALVYHKEATKRLGEVIGKREFYLDNNAHYLLLRQKFNESQSDQQLIELIYSSIKLFFDAASLFKKVVACQELLQSPEFNIGEPKYIWKSYALYNQARCEFAIHLIIQLYENVTTKPFENARDEYIRLSELWHPELREAVSSRRQDYVYFQKQPFFPQFVTFNMQAEYYHAFYEYELSCLIEKQHNPSFEAEDFPSYEDFQAWKEANLTITDVLSVDGKVERIEKLKTDHVREEVKILINSLVDDPEKRDSIYQQLQGFAPDIVAAILSTDTENLQKTKKKFFDRIKEAFSHLQIEIPLEAQVGQVDGFFIKCKASLVLKRKDKK